MKEIDIIIPVYNALQYVRPCIESVVKSSHSSEDLQVKTLLVNDHSDEHVSSFLKSVERK